MARSSSSGALLALGKSASLAGHEALAPRSGEVL